MSSPPRPAPSGSPFYLAAALALAAIIPLLGLPVYFRTDDVHWLGWALGHANPLAAFDPAQNLFGYYRPLPTLAWWVMARLFGFEPLGYQLVLAAVAVGAMVPLFRIGRRLVGHAWGGLLAVALFHGVTLTVLYYVFWYSALTFGLELLLLLLALDAFLDGPDRPGRPAAFVAWALAAGLAKQPALLIVPLVCGGALLQGNGPWRRRLSWTAGIGAAGLALLLVTPFVAHRPEALSGMASAARRAFLAERFAFYAGWILHGPTGPLVALGAVAGLMGKRWAGLPLGLLVGVGLRFLPLATGFPLWCLLLVAAGWRVPATRPWLLGFFLPGALLLGVDFHVATYLLEPLVCLVPPLVLWLAPPLATLVAAPVAWIDARGRGAWSILVPAAIALLLVGAAYTRVPPLVAMRQVRATFRAGVEALLRAPTGTTIGCLTYDELGQTYADIRQRPLGQRVELHKTMNPAQLEKFLRLRGRQDLRIVPLAEARRAPGTVWLFAANSEETDALSALRGVEPFARFARGRAATALFRTVAGAEVVPKPEIIAPQGDSLGVKRP